MGILYLSTNPYTDFNVVTPESQVLDELKNFSGALCVLLDKRTSIDPPIPPEPPPDPVFTFTVSPNAELFATVDQDNISFDTPYILSNPDYGKLIIREE